MGLRVARTLCVRLAVALGTLLLISVITFAATNAVPSDPARVALGKEASPAELAEYRKTEGLNRPVVPRYFEWLEHYLQGNWGHSVLANKLSVRSEVVPRMERTVILGGVSLIFALTLAFLLGAYTGRRSGGPADFLVSAVTLIFNATPEFVTALLVVVLFAVKLDWLPIESASGILYGSGFLDTVKAYIAPVLTLVLVLTPYMTRMVRTNVREVLQQPLARSSVLRGLPNRTVMWKHVVPNAALPVIAVVALTFADILAGVVVVESVFAFPGIGNLFIDSVLGKDLPMVQAVALVVGAGFVLVNLLSDALLVALDPRVRARR
jgi:peptide/nickel transport system permease protein